MVTRLVEMIKSPTSSAADVGELISQDVALTGMTLKLVNSPFYGFSQKVNSITHAIVIMGFSRVKNLALAGSILRTFRSGDSEGFDYNAFWEHAMGSAIAGEALAQAIDSDYDDEAFVAGLLHDQGKLIFIRYFPEEFIKVRKLVERQQITMRLRIRCSVRSLTHRRLARGKVELRASFHGHSDASYAAVGRQHRQLVWLTHAADIFTRALCIGDGGDHSLPTFQTHMGSIGLTSDVVEDVFGNTLSGMAKAGISWI